MMIDPIALLAREHAVIDDRLRLMERAIGSSSKGAAPPSLPDHEVLRDLLEFFTDKVRVHFLRESVLIGALARSCKRTHGDPQRFDALLDEYRALRAQGAQVMRQLLKHLRRMPEELGSDVQAVAALIRQYRDHIRWQECVLFPLAVRRLSLREKLAVGQRMLQV
ncbi:hemerythrin domain-containing protein [Nitrospira sp. Kam-Ns4a]